MCDVCLDVISHWRILLVSSLVTCTLGMTGVRWARYAQPVCQVLASAGRRVNSLPGSLTPGGRASHGCIVVGGGRAASYSSQLHFIFGCQRVNMSVLSQ